MTTDNNEPDFGDDVAPHAHGVPIGILVPQNRQVIRRAQLEKRAGFHDHQATKRAAAAIHGHQALTDTPDEDWQPPKTLT